MSTSSSLSSAKRRRAGNEVLNTPVNNISSSPMVDNGSRIMSVQDVLYMLNGMGINNGINVKKVLAASKFIYNFLGRDIASKTATAMLTK